MLFGHGSDIYKYENKIIADFSSNIWYNGISDELVKYLQGQIRNIIHYPEPDASSLAEKLADQNNVNLQNILVSNGATEAFYLLARLFSGAVSNIVYPSFAEYEDACKINDHKLNYIESSSFRSNMPFESLSLLWLGNPNNPDGKIILRKDIENICENNPTTIIIIDEAYAELCSGFESVNDLVNTYNNLIVVRSLTKAFAIPGIRLGYIVASTSIIEKLKAIKMPWSVNKIAIEAGKFILDNYQKLLPDKNAVSTESKVLQNELNNIAQLEVIPSDCNYFLVKLEKSDAAGLKQYLIENYGLLIRDASNFRGLDNSYFRIAIQKPEYNEMLAEGIKEWIKTNA